jgi:thiamine-phosphate pyrophosphorylase
MTIKGIHVVTDWQLMHGRGHVDIARAAVEAGVPVLQFRDKNLPDKEFYEIALVLRDLAAGTGTTFVVNDRVDIAIAVGADGVHIGQTDMPAAAVRRLIGNSRILGVSATTIEEAIRAERDGADYVGFGPIFSTATKADAAAPTGTEQLRKLSSVIKVPIVAIGGIGEKNVGSVAAAGADAAAVVSAVVCAVDMPAAIVRLSGLFANAAI